VKSGYENMPVVYVSWLDAIRFVNWLQNGQGSGSTESGTYTITGGGHNSGTVAVPAAATRATWTAADPHWVLPSLNEWYKAAYHQPAAQGGDTDDYWLYPTGTNSEPYSDQPPGSGAPVQGNTANFYKNDGVANGYDDGYAVTGSTSFVYTQNYLTNVGAYTQSDSFYGTFDQAANIAEWNEADIYGDGSYRGLRGHEWAAIMPSYYMAASHDYGGTVASTEFFRIGFRVASVPEPGTTVLLVGGAIAGLIWSRWRRIA
jgi:formylglycine-generating enzyme required for sulfatase activity